MRSEITSHPFYPALHHRSNRPHHLLLLLLFSFLFRFSTTKCNLFNDYRTVKLLYRNTS
jgi:hypothetical protein